MNKIIVTITFLLFPFPFLLFPVSAQFTESVLLKKQNPFTHSYALTIDYTQCGTANTSNFPCLVSVTLSTLKSVANGGAVQSITSGIPNDIIFSSSSTYGTYLNWEVESYNSSTGNLVVWVNIPTLSYTANTIFYMAVGSPTIATFQGGAAGSVWSSNYAGVWHLGNGSTLNANDYTTNANNGTITGATATTGEIDAGGNFVVASSQYIQLGNSSSLNIHPVITVAAWINPGSFYNYGNVLFRGDNIGGQYGIILFSTGQWQAEYKTSGGSGTGLSGGTLSTNTWQYLVYTIDAAGGNCKTYLNGALQNTGSGAYVNSISSNVQIGADLVDGRYFDGKIDEVRVGGFVESSSQVTADYNNQKPGSTFVSVAQNY